MGAKIYCDTKGGMRHPTDLVSIVDIGPTEITETGPTRPQAQRQIQFLTDEEPEEALERETNRIITARKVQRPMIRTREKSSSERGRGRNVITNDHEKEIEVI